MLFSQILQITALVLGVIFILVAVGVEIFTDGDGCLHYILAFFGLVLLVYGFTGDSSALHQWVH